MYWTFGIHYYQGERILPKNYRILRNLRMKSIHSNLQPTSIICVQTVVGFSELKTMVETAFV